MIPYPQYVQAVNATSVKNGQSIQNNYIDYTQYEKFWEDYFYDIFLQNANFNTNARLRLIFFESCPAGNFPHPNYIFNNLGNNLNGSTHMYLYQPTRGFQIYNGIINMSSGFTKRDALVYLAKHNVLLMDIFFTHGFNLSTNNKRPLLNQNLNFVCDFKKIRSSVNNCIRCYQNIAVNILFATPPTIQIQPIYSRIGFGNMFRSMNGRNHYPNSTVLINHIHNGY